MPVKKKQTDKPKAVEKPACNPATLGLKTVVTDKSVEVKVGTTDLGKDLVTWRNIPVETEKVTPDLSLDEAKLLTECYGKQEWRPWGDQGEQFACRFDDGNVQRRFIISKATMDVLNEG